MLLCKSCRQRAAQAQAQRATWEGWRRRGGDSSTGSPPTNPLKAFGGPERGISSPEIVHEWAPNQPKAQKSSQSVTYFGQKKVTAVSVEPAIDLLLLKLTKNISHCKLECCCCDHWLRELCWMASFVSWVISYMKRIIFLGEFHILVSGKLKLYITIKRRSRSFSSLRLNLWKFPQDAKLCFCQSEGN